MYGYWRGIFSMKSISTRLNSTMLHLVLEYAIRHRPLRLFTIPFMAFSISRFVRKKEKYVNESRCMPLDRIVAYTICIYIQTLVRIIAISLAMVIDAELSHRYFVADLLAGYSLDRHFLVASYYGTMPLP